MAIKIKIKYYFYIASLVISGLISGLFYSKIVRIRAS